MSNATNKPNIVFILVDQLTAMALRAYNKDAVTIAPTLDKMLAGGIVFQNAYCSSPLCTPSRYGVMTGQYVKNHHGYDNSALIHSLKPTFAHYARLAGYETILAGKMHFVGPDQLHGFERRLTTDCYPADFGWVPDWQHPRERIDLWYHNMSSVKQSGVAAITNQLEYDDEVLANTKRTLYQLARRDEKTARPFLLTIGFIHPHDPYVARQQYWDQYNDVKIPLPTSKRPKTLDNDPHSLRLERAIDLDRVDITDDDIIRSRRAYFANVTMIDDYVAQIMAVLEENGQLDNTMIVFSSDHGDFLGERGLWYKMSFLDYPSKVPLVFYQPTKFGHRVVEQPVSLIDLLPTFNDITGYRGDLADVVDGVSLAAMLTDKRDNKIARDYVITEYCAEGAIEPMVMVRGRHLKYIYAPSDPELLYLCSDKDGGEEAIALTDKKYEKELTTMRALAQKHWDDAGGVEAVRQKILANQHARRIIHASLRLGDYYAWDFQPHRDATVEYTRSHLDLTSFDTLSRFPRPPKFP
ncbi:MAG: choline-sulfatase [Hydrotalea sp.]|nr:choline-sulfatase [Hydrotalea sp.]